MSLRSVFLFLSSAALACAVPGAPAARACGGFFCSNATQPIAQGGEKIVFAIEPDGSITAVVQITYTGPADTFAWVLPVPSVPTVSVGTTALVQALDQATTPQYARAAPTTEGTCAVPPLCTYPSGGGGGCCFGAAASRGFFDGGAIRLALDAASSDAAPRADMGVTVLARAEVGPYQYVVLTGSTSMAIHDWLVTNGYLVPDTTVPLLDPYVAQHSDFIAVKLTKDPATTELPNPVGNLAPLVLHYTNGEPCIPIRLTALATVPDMPITAFFLADADVRPDNYPETELPEDPMLWTAGGTLTYDTILSRAADDAGGHAWVREYTGVVPRVVIPYPDALSLQGYVDPKSFVAHLVSIGLSLDAQVLAILAAALPPPPGVSTPDFFSCLAGYCSTYDTYLAGVTFDATATAMRLDTEVVGGLRDAMAMLNRHHRLTRLATTMSAEEMTLDPTFTLAATTRDVSNVHTARYITKCDAAHLTGPLVLRMPSGVESPVSPGVPYPGADAYCASVGGHPVDSVTPGAGGSRGCAIASSAPPLAPLVVALVIGVGGWRLRQRLRRR